jgi:TM2 domain-containing membrane protein YozV
MEQLMSFIATNIISIIIIYLFIIFVKWWLLKTAIENGIHDALLQTYKEVKENEQKNQNNDKGKYL